MSTRALSLVPAIAVLLLFGCDSELDRPVEFVVPEGFTGAFVLISCADYPDHIEKLSDRYRLSIPADGVFRTRDTSIFSKWHTGSAIFAKTRTRAPLIASYSGGFGDKRKTPCVWSWYYIGDAKSKGEFFNTPGKNEEWLRARGIDPYGGPAAL